MLQQNIAPSLRQSMINEALDYHQNMNSVVFQRQARNLETYARESGKTDPSPKDVLVEGTIRQRISDIGTQIQRLNQTLNYAGNTENAPQLQGSARKKRRGRKISLFTPYPDEEEGVEEAKGGSDTEAEFFDPGTFQDPILFSEGVIPGGRHERSIPPPPQNPPPEYEARPTRLPPGTVEVIPPPPPYEEESILPPPSIIPSSASSEPPAPGHTFSGSPSALDSSKIKTVIDASLTGIVSGYNSLVDYLDLQIKQRSFSKQEEQLASNLLRDLLPQLKLLIANSANAVQSSGASGLVDYTRIYNIISKLISCISSSPPFLKVPIGILTEKLPIREDIIAAENFDPEKEKNFSYLQNISERLKDELELVMRTSPKSPLEKEARELKVQEIQQTLNRISSAGFKPSERIVEDISRRALEFLEKGDLQQRRRKELEEGETRVATIQSGIEDKERRQGEYKDLESEIGYLRDAVMHIDTVIFQEGQRVDNLTDTLRQMASRDLEIQNEYQQIIAVRNSPGARFSDEEIANFDSELEGLTQEYQYLKDERVRVISDLVYYRDSILRPAETRREEIIQELRDLLPQARDLSPEAVEQAKEALSLTQKSIQETKEELKQLDSFLSRYSPAQESEKYAFHSGERADEALRKRIQRQNRIAPLTKKYKGPLPQGISSRPISREEQEELETGNEPYFRNAQAEERLAEARRRKGNGRTIGGHVHKKSADPFGDNSELAPYLTKYLRPSKYRQPSGVPEIVSSSEESSDGENDQPIRKKVGGKKKRVKAIEDFEIIISAPKADRGFLLEKKKPKRTGGKKKVTKPVHEARPEQDLWFM